MAAQNVNRPVVWRGTAKRNLADIIAYIADRNPPAAKRLKSVIEDSVLPLLAHPLIFRKGRIEGTREIVAHPNYIVVYRVQEDCIEIVNVIHARQQYP
jgi:toxin ParE1/3/4